MNNFPMILNQLSAQVTGTFKDAIDVAVLNKTVSVDSPKIPRNILDLIRQKRKIYRSFIRTGNATIGAFSHTPE